MKKFGLLIIILTTLLSCNTDTKIPNAIAEIPVDITVDRFDKIFASSSYEDLEGLKLKYPYLFSKRYSDDYWRNKFQDTLQKELEAEVAMAFPDVKNEQTALEDLFKHIKYYYPEVMVPKMVTIISDVDYDNKVILVDSLLLVALDTYLGPEHHFYGNIPKFKSKNFRPAQIDVDVAAAFAKAQILKPQEDTFLAQIIYEGKQLYFMEQLLSTKPQHEIFGYTATEFQFAEENEKNVWEYFVTRQLVYSTDRTLAARFIYPAPFSKFRLEFDNETPGRLGRYLGYKIVASYMEKNDVALKNMIIQPADVIFASAKYKP